MMSMQLQGCRLNVQSVVGQLDTVGKRNSRRVVGITHQVVTNGGHSSGAYCQIRLALDYVALNQFLSHSFLVYA